MKNYLALAILLCICSTASYCQDINWSDYKEPDGKFERFYIDPSITFRYRNNEPDESTQFDLNFNSFYNVNEVKELTTFSFVVNPLIAIATDNNDNLPEAVTSSSISVNPWLQYRKYFNERRGWFTEGRFLSFIQFQDNSISESRFNDFFRPELLVGYGRLENVSTVYQSLRIRDQIGAENLTTQDQIFSLADLMRRLDYNNLLDSRYRNIDIQTQYLEHLAALGVPLDDYYAIANAIDAFRFERPNYTGHGFEVKAGLTNSFSFTDDSDQFGAKLRIDYGKAINQRWHTQMYGDYTQSFDGMRSILAGVEFRYIPTNRTSVNLNQDIAVLSNDFSDQVSSRTRAGMQYFVSPFLSLYGSLLFTYTDRSFTGFSNTNLTHNIGLRYYFI